MVKKKCWSFLVFFLISFFCFPQSESQNFLKPSDTLNKSRRNAVIITEISLATLSLISLNELWYNDFSKSSFHTINDTNEWLQMDKFGHVFSSYQLSRLGAESIKWSGVNQKEQLIYGASLSMGFLTAVEIFDGFSEEWGFSWSDFAANSVGTGMYVGQELLWNEQRVSFKYSFHRTSFAEQRPDKLGDNFLQEVFKDYNGQTYWLSFNVHSFFKNSNWPQWLNISFGYGAHGMLTGENEDLDMIFADQDRIRQYYLSLDLDLTKIRTNSHFLKTIFSVINVLKVPFPTLEINSKKGVVFHLMYY